MAGFSSIIANDIYMQMKRVKSPRKGQAQSSTDVLQDIFRPVVLTKTGLHCIAFV